MSELRNIQGLRILALALAILTWYFVRASEIGPEAEMITFTREYPIQYTVPSNVLILDATESIQLTLQGRESVVRIFNPLLVRVSVEIRQSVSGPLEVVLTDRNLTLPEGITATSIVPSAVTVVIDLLSTQNMPVVAAPTGEADAGALVEEIVVTPAVVAVSGPESELRKHDSLFTPPVDLTGHAINFRQRAAIVLPENVTIVEGPRFVTIDVRLRIPGTEDNTENDQAAAGEETSGEPTP